MTPLRALWKAQRCLEFDRLLHRQLRGDSRADTSAPLPPDCQQAPFGRALASPNIVALYWEFDLDNRWDSAVFGRLSYEPSDPEWTADFIWELDGPDLPQYAALYSENGFSGSDVADGITVLLVARTLASFVRALKTVRPTGIAVAAGYQDAGMIAEPS